MKRWLSLAAVIFFLVLFAGYVYSVWESYHDFEGRCLDCHLYEPGEEGGATTYVKDISLMCEECHGDILEFSHPVDVTPTMEVPGPFPLDWKGTVTCSTCHPVHTGGYGDFRLRVKAEGQGFCLFCHDDMEDDLHMVGLGTAHTASTVNTGYDPSEPRFALDALSLKCLSCHDALFGVESLVESRTVGFHRPMYLGLSHPIGVSYIEARYRFKGAYRAMDDLPPEINLYGGMVGCGTCHNPYSKEHSKLVMSNEGSRLCLACHRK